MSNHDPHVTKGKQQMLYGNASLGGILLITALFLLNAVLFFSIDCFLIHTIPKAEMELPALEAHIPGEILSELTNNGTRFILYRTPEGERKLVLGKENLFSRYRLDLKNAEIIPGSEDPYDYNGIWVDYTIEGDMIMSARSISPLSWKMQASAIAALCFLVTCLEQILFRKLRGQ